LGFGDVRLSLVLGVALGWLGIRYVILGFFSANLIGAILGVALIAMKKMSRDQPIPFGVFLSLGAALAIYAGPELLIPFQRFT
jgi:leader peptidase (prepilin peptidase)/N-methyltransferase